MLRGSKTTSERDYIIAICIALELNLAQTQHALKIYGMPLLSREDVRSLLIMEAVNRGSSLTKLNEMLENAHQPYIKVSPEMPSARITISGDAEQLVKQIETEIHVKSTHTYRELASETFSEHCGCAPIDFRYWGILLAEDENGHKYYVCDMFDPLIECFFVVDGDMITADLIDKKAGLQEAKEQIWELMSDGEEENLLEEFATLEEASGSDFFTHYITLDQITNKKVSSTMDAVDDTRNYGGMRIGANWIAGRCNYIEAFNTQQPEEKEYLQVVERDGVVTYTASHTSQYMSLEMGEDLYKFYFHRETEPEFFVNTKDLNTLVGSKYASMIPIFQELLRNIHKYTDASGIQPREESLMVKDQMTELISYGDVYYEHEKYDTAISYYMQALPLIEKIDTDEADRMIIRGCTWYKLATSYAGLNDSVSMMPWLDKIYDAKQELFNAMQVKEAWRCGLLYAIADATICRDVEGDAAIVEIWQQVIDLLDCRCEVKKEWKMLVQAYCRVTSRIDTTETEKAEGYYEAAVNIIREQDLDRDDSVSDVVLTIYNNYAWFLWNVQDDMEATYYYRKAIEVSEDLKKRGKAVQHADHFIEHCGKALLSLYEDVDLRAEYERVKARLIKDGVSFEAE